MLARRNQKNREHKVKEDWNDNEKLHCLGEEIRAQRTRLQLSQEELAKRAGLHRTYMSDIERGIRNPTILVVINIADALEIQAAVLVSVMQG